jgi:cellulose synthase/poly-beta-1,6-N-acetylglucosamine synthase-like glycosyltransferase
MFVSLAQNFVTPPPPEILLLVEHLMWEVIERSLSSKYIQQYKPYPLPSAEDRLHNASDVSIVVPTVGWDVPSFTTALISWLANGPREIVVVTVDAEEASARALLDSDAIRAAAANAGLQIKLMTIARANKRDQLVEGINASEGSIIALVDDDAFWTPTTLAHLLSPFQDAEVGLVGGPIESHVPPKRQNSAVITSWEVAALWNRSRRRGGNRAFFAADRSTNFTISGATMLLRAEVLKDAVFQREFTQETFLGMRQNTGDDSFITRWVLFQHLRPDRRDDTRTWRLGIQLTPEATVLTTLMTDSRFARQMKRWMRTGLRYRITMLFYEPGFKTFWRATPYMCRKMVEGMYNPVHSLLWYLAFFVTLYKRPIFGLLVGLWYLYGTVTGLMSFAREFPYCRRKLWAAVAADRVFMVSDWYCWLILASESWDSRQGVDHDGNTA